MLHHVMLPQLSSIVKQAQILAWTIKPGDFIEVDEPLCELQLSKLIYEFTSPHQGYLRQIFYPPGSFVDADAVIAIISDQLDEPLPQSKQGNDLSENQADYCNNCCATDKGCELNPVLTDTKVEPLNGMRQTIAARMLKSARTIPQFNVATTIDATHCQSLRQKYRTMGKRVSFLDILIKAAAATIQKYPRFTAVFAAGQYHLRQNIDIGFAIAIADDYLAVPVIRKVTEKSLEEIALESRQLIDLAGQKKLLPEHLVNGVFTVSNLGMYEVERFEALVNPGEAAILAVGRMLQRPYYKDSQWEARPTVELTLSCDHQIIDGALAAKFITAYKWLLEHPESLE